MLNKILLIFTILVVVLLSATVYVLRTRLVRQTAVVSTFTPTLTPTLISPSPSFSPYPISSPFAYPAGLTGYAISWAQCRQTYPDLPFDFGIIDVTGGWSLSHNPCLRLEFAWARQALYPPTFYVNLTYPGPEYRHGIDTPRQYGYETARDAYEYANSQGAFSSMWWLDIQTKSTWSEDKAINAEVVLGAIDFFKEKKLNTGLSTTPYQWGKIVGDLKTGLPNWIPGIPGKANALTYCSSGKSYSGGYVQQIADIATQFETVYTCGAPNN